MIYTCLYNWAKCPCYIFTSHITNTASGIVVSGNTAGLSGFPFYQDGLSTNYGLFQYLHGNAIDGNSTGGYINNNGVTANFIDGNGFAGASFIDGSTKYIMVQGIYQTDA